jgi:uncharacterized protein (DUF3820 family)
MLMPFGKAWRIEDIPADYLEWLHNRVAQRGRLKEEVQETLASKRVGLPASAHLLSALEFREEDRNLLKQPLDAGYRVLSFKYPGPGPEWRAQLS